MASSFKLFLLLLFSTSPLCHALLLRAPKPQGNRQVRTHEKNIPKLSIYVEIPGRQPCNTSYRSSTSQPAVMRCCAGSVQAQIQLRKHALDNAGHTAPALQHEARPCGSGVQSASKYVDRQKEIDHRSDVYRISSTAQQDTTGQTDRPKTLPSPRSIRQVGMME